LGNLEVVLLGISVVSFTVDNMKDTGKIFASDPNGDIISFEKNFHTGDEKTNIMNRDPNSKAISVICLNSFNMGLVNKLSGINTNNKTYVESTTAVNNDILWKTVSFGGRTMIANDFAVFSGRHFFCNVSGGLTQTGGKRLDSTVSTEPIKTIFQNIKFQACAIDGPNRKLYALDTESTGNNLYIFELDKNLEFQKSKNKNESLDEINYLIVKPSIANLYLNNLVIIPRLNSNIINGDEIELVFVASKIGNKTGDVNLYSGKIFFGLGETPDPTCEWNGLPSGIVAKCGDQIVADWGLGKTFTGKVEDPYAGEVNINKNKMNCLNYIRQKNPIGEKRIIVDCSTMRNASLELTKLVDKDFNGLGFLEMKKEQDFSNEGDKLYNIVAESMIAIAKMDAVASARSGSNRWIELAFSEVTGDILVGLDGVL